MRNDPSNSGERFYRMLDGIYRVHDDLYYIEDAVQRGSAVQVRLAQIASQSRLGAAIATLVAGVPIVIDVSPIEWSDASAKWLMAASVLLVIYLGWQLVQAGKVARELRTAQELSGVTPLQRRLDYHLERINADAHRLRVVQEVIAEIEEARSAGGDASVLDKRLVRYREIADECTASIARIVATSKTMVLTEERSAEDHGHVVDWATPFLDDEQVNSANRV